jgi:hypothetical protein
VSPFAPKANLKIKDHTSSNIKDIKTKQNEASILASFNIKAKQTLLISKIIKDQSEANSASSKT